jgi:hypothetical protein
MRAKQKINYVLISSTCKKLIVWVLVSSLYAVSYLLCTFVRQRRVEGGDLSLSCIVVCSCGTAVLKIL